MQCPTCQKTIPDASPYCAYCGAVRKPAALTRRSWPLWAVALLALTARAVAGWWAGCAPRRSRRL